MKMNLLKAALFTPYSRGRWGLPILAWSAPGEAKTAAIEEICATYGLPCVTLSPGEQGEGAFGVVPVPKGDLLTYPPPEWTQLVEKGGCVFVDEVTSAGPALQPPLMGLFLARRVGGTVLGPRVRVLAAANPPELAAGGYDLPPPVANRMGHIDWTPPTVDEHADYLLRGTTSHAGSDPAPAGAAAAEESRVLELWPEAWARAVGLETAFLRRRPDRKNACPEIGDAASGRAWPSDRSWENATRALASSYVHRLSDAEREEFVGAFIGKPTAKEFFTFIAEQDLPDPVEILEGKAKFVHESRRLDRTFAVLSACTAIVAPKEAPNREKRVGALWELAGSLGKDPSIADLLVPTMRTLVKAGFGAHKAAGPVLSACWPTLQAAGITGAAGR